MDNGAKDTESDGLTYGDLFHEVGGKKQLLVRQITQNEVDGQPALVLDLTPHQLKFLVDIGLTILMQRGEIGFVQDSTTEQHIEGLSDLSEEELAVMAKDALKETIVEMVQEGSLDKKEQSDAATYLKQVDKKDLFQA